MTSLPPFSPPEPSRSSQLPYGISAELASKLVADIEAMGVARSVTPKLFTWFMRPDLLNALSEDLAKGQTRLALVGDHGMGKSALAARLATRFASNQQGRALWLDMSDSGAPPGEWARTLLMGLRAPLGSIPDRTSDRLMMLNGLLDQNDVVVLDAPGDLHAAAEIVASVPAVTWITTSKSSVRVRAQVVRLDLLDPGTSAASLRQRCPSLTAKEAHLIARGCGGNPMALDLVASAVRVGQGVASFLSTAREDSRAGIEFAIECATRSSSTLLGLDPLELRLVLRRVSLFPGFFDRDLIAALLPYSYSRCQEITDQLKNVGLLSRDPVLGYRMPVGVRTLLKTDKSGRRVAESRSVAKLIEKKASPLEELDASWDSPPRRRPSDAPSMPVEPSALIPATHWLEKNWYLTREVLVRTQQQGWDDHAQRLLTALRPFMVLARRLTDATEAEERVLWTSRSIANRSAQLGSLHRLVRDHLRSGEPGEASLAQADAIRLARSSGDPQLLWNELALGSEVSIEAGDVEAAQKQLEEALSVARSIGHVRSEVRSLVALAGLPSAVVEAADALGALTRARVMLTTLDYDPDLDELWLEIGKVYLSLGEPSSAVEAFAHVIDSPQYREYQDETLVSALKFKGEAELKLAHYSLAEQSLKQALSLSRKLDDSQAEIELCTVLGDVATEQQHIDLAIEYYRQAIALTEATGGGKLTATAFINLGNLYASVQDWRNAELAYLAALERTNASGDPYATALALANLGLAYVNSGRPAEAKPLLQRSLALLQRLKQDHLSISVQQILATAAVELGDLQLAEESLEHSISLARRIGDREAEIASLKIIGNVYHDLGLETDASKVQHRLRALTR